jgi:hypothetical protein
MNLKKFLSLLLAGILALGLLAGCGENTPEQGSHSAGQQKDPEALSTGLLILNCEATFEITYDKDGNVLSINGLDDPSISIADKYNTHIGKSCTVAVQELIRLSMEAELLTPETPTIIIKQGHDSPLPSEDFLSNIVADAEVLAEDIPVYLISQNQLTETGYLDFDTAKELVTIYLGMEEAPVVTGDPTPVMGLYAMSISSTTQLLLYTVDAHTGKVAEGYPGGEVGDYILDIDPNGAMYDPNDPFLFPDEIPTEPEETDEFIEETDEFIFEEPTI